MACFLTETNTLKKEDIIFYLNNYINLISVGIANPNIEFEKLSEKWVMDNYGSQFLNGDFYYNTIRIYEFMLYKQIYSYSYDSIFPDLKESTIKNISLPKNIFVNPDDEKRFSKKQVIKFIRNAINHNDSDTGELYHIVQSNNKLILDIHLLNTKPIPFHVQIDIEDFLNLTQMLISEYNPDITITYYKSKINYFNPDILGELDKIAIRRYNFNGNDSINVSNIMQEIMNNGNINHTDLKKLNISTDDYIDYNLSISQKIKIQQDVEEFKKMGIPLNDKLINYLVSNVSQFGGTKALTLYIDFFICDHYLGRKGKCLQDFQNDVISYANGDKNSYLNQFNSDISNIDFMFYRAWDFDQLFINGYNVLISYLFDTYIKDEKINIAGRNIDRKKMRDSFVHGKFYIGGFGKYKLFDSYTGRNNESNINWKETIQSTDLAKFVNQIVKPIIKNYSINIPIRIFETPSKYICCTLNNTMLFCFLDDSNFDEKSPVPKYVICKIDKSGVSLANDMEKNMFLEQINLLPVELKKRYQTDFDIIFSNNNTATDNQKVDNQK